MVFIKYSGRMGNILFQYTFARLLCEFSGAKLCTDLKNLNMAKNRTNDGILFFKENHIIKNLNFFDLDNCHIMGKNASYSLINLNFEDLIQIAKNKDIIMENFHPQLVCFFSSYKQWIKENIKIKEGEYKKTEDLVCAVRIGDYFSEEFKNFFSYPLEAIPHLLKDVNINYKNLTIVTDTPKDANFLELMKGFEYDIISNDILYDFRTILNAKRLVITPSTFYWWAAFLSEAEEIFLPINMGPWKHRLNKDKTEFLKHSIILKQSNIKYYNKKGYITYEY